MQPTQVFLNISDDKRKRIIDVSMEEFCQNGYQKASINTIVKRLGIAKGSIFQYFGDKERFFRFIFQLSLEKVKDHLRAVRDRTASADFFSRIEATLRAGVTFIHDNPLIYRLYLRVLVESPLPFRQELLSLLRRHSHDFLKELIDQAQKAGEVRADMDADRIAFFLDAMMDRFLQAQCVEHLDAGLGLYQISAEGANPWICHLVEMVRAGVGCQTG